ncbi:putative polysaccharide biosynthesis protein [Bacillus alkalicola]|uniref:Polysaccharide biosynthesis protein n=1 Tax=Evansella alkalicola TaxID=745819 RepID=A0ABS6JTV1_9BACI|nr:polysaccharide biosynthesis protein [Bacillus alkalicola]
MVKNNETGSWLKGAFYLSFAALIVKVLSALYKVPYQNMTGDLGYYVYQQVYPLYGIALVLSTYGYPLVIAKMTADWRNSKDNINLGDRLSVLFIWLFIIHAAAGAGIIIFSETISIWMGDANLTTPLRWMGLPFFMIPFLAVGRGYYQGLENMIPTAFSQVVEQVVRVIAILAVAWVLIKYDPYLAGISAGAGALLGGIAGFITLVAIMKKDVTLTKLLKERVQGIFHFHQTWKKDVKELFTAGFFVSVSAMSLIIFQLIDAFTIYRTLELNGMNQMVAAELKGVYDRAWPIVQMGAVVTTVFSYAVIPYVSKAVALNRREHLQALVKQAIKICLVFGSAATIGLIAIMPHLNPMLFGNAEGTTSLQILSGTVLFAALFMTMAALLHAVGNAGYAAGILLIGIALKVILNILLIPIYSIEGAAIASTTAFVCMSLVLFIILIRKKLMLKWNHSFFIKTIVSLAVMMIVVVMYQWGMTQLIVREWGELNRLLHTLLSLSSAVLGACLFIITIWLFRLFTKKEWEELPKVSKILPYR